MIDKTGNRIQCLRASHSFHLRSVILSQKFADHSNFPKVLIEFLVLYIQY